jgi:hypothetical protein
MDYIIRKHQSKPQNKRYFTKNTEDAIIKYNNSTNENERSELYANFIHWPFYKLTENIIHTFKFYHTDGVENLEDLQHEIIVFLLSKIHLFNPNNGAKAYSYFGTIVKRWLIAYNKNNYNKKINNIPITDLSNHLNSDSLGSNSNNSNNINKEFNSKIEIEKFTEFIEEDELGMKGYKEKDKLSWFIDQYANYCTKNIFEIFPKNNDAQIADAVLELFRKRDMIDVFNKKALYIYIREQIDVKTPKITKITNILYDIFKEKYLYYLDYGKFPS